MADNFDCPHFDRGFDEGWLDASHGRTFRVRNYGNDPDGATQAAYQRGYMAGYDEGNEQYR